MTAHTVPHFETAPSGKTYCRCYRDCCWDLGSGHGFYSACACAECDCVGSNHREMEGRP